MIGGEVAAQLAAAGHPVRCLLRQASSPPATRHPNLEVRRVDLSDPAALAAALSGVQWVFHVAGYLHSGSPFSAGEDYAPYRAANVDLTDRMLAASAAAGVRRFVFASTTGVYRPGVPAPIGEDCPLAPLSAYGRSKVEAEGLVRAYGARGLSFTIVRPSATYGPGDRHFLPAALAMARMRRVPLVDGGRHLIDFGYVADVARLMVRAAGAAAADGATYNAASGHPQPLRTLFDLHAELTGGPPPAIVPVPAGLCRALGPLLQVAVRLLAPDMSAMVTRDALAYLSRDVSYDMSRAYRDFGYAPEIDFRTGLARVLESGGLDPAGR
jgi:nucleoside-diphosphate-sugar epimerase